MQFAAIYDVARIVEEEAVEAELKERRSRRPTQAQTETSASATISPACAPLWHCLRVIVTCCMCVLHSVCDECVLSVALLSLLFTPYPSKGPTSSLRVSATVESVFTHWMHIAYTLPDLWEVQPEWMCGRALLP